MSSDKGKRMKEIYPQTWNRLSETHCLWSGYRMKVETKNFYRSKFLILNFMHQDLGPMLNLNYYWSTYKNVTELAQL